MQGDYTATSGATPQDAGINTVLNQPIKQIKLSNVNSNQEDIKVAVIQPLYNSNNHLIQFPGFPSMEDENNFIYNSKFGK